MTITLSHLPDFKQHQILAIVSIIKEVVGPEKIVLFGSYATGTWVEDQYFENGIRYSYISDFDFLVVTKDNTEKEHILTDKIVNRSKYITDVAVNCIILDIDYVNEGLSFGQYFFTDIVNEGVVLYDTGNVEFTQPKALTADEQKARAQNYYDIWFFRGNEFLIDAENAFNRKSNSKAAFELHQATECFYNTLLLVSTGYKPKTHSLEKLRQYAKPHSKEIAAIFPEHTEEKTESHLFDLLKRSYIDARYKTDYTITGEELTALITKVKNMQAAVQRACEEKIASFA